MQQPSKTFLNAVHLHSIACNGYRHAAKVMRDHKVQGFGIGLEGALVAIIFSAASLEAFIAEVPFLIDLVSGEQPSLRKVGAVLNDAEESQIQARGKFLIAKALLASGFDRGKNPFQDFNLLIRIRNAIIHMKPDVVGEDPHKFVLALQSRGLCDPNEAPNNSWMDQIATLPTAKWACNVASAMVRALCANDDGTQNALGSITTAMAFSMFTDQK